MKGEQEGEQMALRASKEKGRSCSGVEAAGRGGTESGVQLSLGSWRKNHSLGGSVFSGVTMGVCTGHLYMKDFGALDSNRERRGCDHLQPRDVNGP